MPFYEYQCSSCQHHLEALQKISETPLRKCPNCGKQTLKRLISAPVFRLKGGGWYETDFKSDQEKKRNLAGGEEAAPAKTDDVKATAKEPAKADAKPSESKPAPAKTEAVKSTAKLTKTAGKAIKSKPAKSVPKKKTAKRR